MSYKHFSITEREKLMFHLAQGLSLCKIAKILGRDKSTISRELKRNTGEYLPSKAQAAYRKRRKKCRPHKLLENPDLFALVKHLFLDLHWSSEQKRSTGNRGAIRKLRHKGKPRRKKDSTSQRGKIPISHELSERPAEANERARFGDFEADTVLGKLAQATLLTLVDRKSRFLLCSKLTRLDDKEVETASIKLLGGHRLCSITPDRGREFRRHCNVTKALGVEFYFPKPRHPWQRGTNENTNGLLREYFPKGYDFNALSDEDLQKVVAQLNHRPRKCLGYKTPQEVYFSVILHFS